jgi:hypothetical protein
LESVYQAALVFELMQLGLKVFSQVGPVNYNGVLLELGFRIDVLVEADRHKKQILCSSV